MRTSLTARGRLNGRSRSCRGEIAGGVPQASSEWIPVGWATTSAEPEMLAVALIVPEAQKGGANVEGPLPERRAAIPSATGALRLYRFAEGLHLVGDLGQVGRARCGAREGSTRAARVAESASSSGIDRG